MLVNTLEAYLYSKFQFFIEKNAKVNEEHKSDVKFLSSDFI